VKNKADTHKVRVFLVDDHPIISELLAVNLETEGMEVRVADSLEASAVLSQAAEFNPGVVVLDLDLSGTLSLPLIAPLRKAGATVLVLTGMKDKALLGRCLEEGAVAVLSKESDFDRLRQAVGDAAEGRPILSERERIDLLDAAAEAGRRERDRLAPFRTLTKREAVVLAHLVNARSAEEIAAAEFVSMATVRSQIQAVLRKLGVNSQLGAVALANERGWTPADAPGD
jgi:two-component system, NarL family, nitrate/nitrite response regulator NarL